MPNWGNTATATNETFFWDNDPESSHGGTCPTLPRLDWPPAGDRICDLNHLEPSPIAHPMRPDDRVQTN
jgi:hypothetical protein